METLFPPYIDPIEKRLDVFYKKRLTLLEPYINQLGERWTDPQPGLIPRVIDDVGLGILSPYVPNLYDLYEEGWEWNKRRGTIKALYDGLSFLALTGTRELFPDRRKFWNSFNVHLEQIPTADLLPNVAGVVNASKPECADLMRVIHGYNIKPAEPSFSRLSNVHLSAGSGARIDGVNSRFSFGEDRSFQITLGEADIDQFGFYVAPGDALPWKDVAQPWKDINVPWRDLGPGLAVANMARQLVALGVFVGFYRPDGSLIGARRVKALHQVQAGSTYKVGEDLVSPHINGSRILVEALTAFNDGAGELAQTVSLLFGASPKAGVKKGKRWLQPTELEFPFSAVGTQEIALRMTSTKRDRIRFLINFI
ncbi:hypothetical protein ACQU0X_28690 [Pseudovibrio ascidiaceicola]|uniref:hypothetical protein n=1 Tax=Pseudovibrio ascidiaceicola TaxID=285279 RepID=UPI003D361445